jgi:ketosteroid isomerase-like protein
LGLGPCGLPHGPDGGRSRFSPAGREPFGKQAFADASRRAPGVRIDPASDIQEIRVAGEWAWMRSRLRVTMTPPGGGPVVRSGYTLTILRKDSGGRWLVTRDANLLTVEPPG